MQHHRDRIRSGHGKTLVASGPSPELAFTEMTLLILRIIAASLNVLLFVYFAYTVIAIFRGAAPIPSRRATVMRMLTLAGLKPGEILLDLGSGDGRILFAASTHGARAIGIEINPLLCWYSRFAAYVLRKGNITVRCSNFWDADLSEIDVLTVYLVPKFMARLKEKVQREMKVGARVVVAVYPFPEWVPEATDKNVFLYKIKADILLPLAQ